mgnify:CR=1 FL=1
MLADMSITNIMSIPSVVFSSHSLNDWIRAIAIINNTDAIIFNPAGYTHTSVALRDAILAVQIPFFEVHISDIESREDFRQKSYFSDIAKKVFSGHGTDGYTLALKEAIKEALNILQGGASAASGAPRPEQRYL